MNEGDLQHLSNFGAYSMPNPALNRTGRYIWLLVGPYRRPAG